MKNAQSAIAIYKGADTMNHHQLTNLTKGTRLSVWRNGAYHKATFMGHIHGADPAAWIAFDDEQIEGRGPIAVRMTTGLQFTPEYFEERQLNKPRKFLLLLTEDSELIEGMERDEKNQTLQAL